ncbi:MAG: exosortase [Sedimentisphaerales bacterium]
MKQNANAVILVGSRDFGRCPLASRLTTALWPVVGEPVLDRLLKHLAYQGIRRAVICASEKDLELSESIRGDNRLELGFLNESLPVGTAGCLRDAAGGEDDALSLVFPAGLVSPPDIAALIDAHEKGRSDLTVLLNPGCGNGTTAGSASGIYVMESRVLAHVPEAGYVDIKEGLIPGLLRAGRTVHAATSARHAGNFRNWREYLYAVADYLERAPALPRDLTCVRSGTSRNVWVAADAKIDPTARIQGPVVVMNGATVSKGAVVLGPTILGRRVSVGQDSVVVGSIVWDDAHIDSKCAVRRSVVDSHAVVRTGALVEETAVAFEQTSFLADRVGRAAGVARRAEARLRRAARSQLGRIVRAVPREIRPTKNRALAYLGAVALLAALLWSYRPGLTDLWNLWHRSDEYSVGMIVPFLALYVLWSRRNVFAGCPVRPSVWGLFVFIGAQFIRFFGLFFMYNSAERFSIIVSIAGLVLLLFGWQIFRKAFTILLFLCLTLPPPNLIQNYTVLHLQHWATSSAVFCLEMIGCGVVQEGNTIHIGQTSVEVAYACNGLRMITAFFVISGLVVLLVSRAWWEKLIVLISSLPIALLCNTARLTITAFALTKLKGQFWDDLFHDFGGYAMMPLALAIVVIELWLLTKLTTLPEAEDAIIVTRQRA